MSIESNQRLLTVDDQKHAAAQAAAALIEAGMALGLGTGSTADHFVRALAERVRHGLKLKAVVATSNRTAELAKSLGLTLSDLNEVRRLDVTVDGADEIDQALSLIKGGGGAHLREKIVAAASRRMVVIADREKLVSMLGAFPLPIEVVPFGWKVTHERIAEAVAKCGCAANFVKLRGSGLKPVLTDQGHYILDCAAERIPDPARLASLLNEIPGVVEHGLFVGMAATALIGTAEGVISLAAEG